MPLLPPPAGLAVKVMLSPTRPPISAGPNVKLYPMPANWLPEALKAQAVAARTYALTTDAGGTVFDQFADTRSQVYRGVSVETAASNEAVAETRGQVVTYDGRPVTT